MVQFKWVSYMVCEFCLNKILLSVCVHISIQHDVYLA